MNEKIGRTARDVAVRSHQGSRPDNENKEKVRGCVVRTRSKREILLGHWIIQKHVLKIRRGKQWKELDENAGAETLLQRATLLQFVPGKYHDKRRHKTGSFRHTIRHHYTNDKELNLNHKIELNNTNTAACIFHFPSSHQTISTSVLVPNGHKATNFIVLRVQIQSRQSLC